MALQDLLQVLVANAFLEHLLKSGVKVRKVGGLRPVHTLRDPSTFGTLCLSLPEGYSTEGTRTTWRME